MSKKRKWFYRIAVIILAVIAAVLLFVFGSYQIGKMKANKLVAGENITDKVVYWSEEYQYNKDLINILCIGVDKEENMNLRNDVDNSVGQADVICLLSMDVKTKEIRLLSIPRDTMVQLQMFDASGAYVGEQMGPIALQYAYGDGMEQSAKMVTGQTATLINSIPIHAYLAINVHSLWMLNDAVGGVDLIMDGDYTFIREEFEQGKTVHLTDKLLENYIRGRDKTTSGSDQMRMHRIKQYMLAFFEKAKIVVKEDMTLPFEMMKMMKDDMVTSVSASEVLYLVTQALQCSFDAEHMYTLPGKIIRNGNYEEYYLDEAAAEDLLMELFYIVDSSF